MGGETMTEEVKAAPRLMPGDEELHGHGISLTRLTKTYTRRSGEKVRAVDGVSLDVERGEFLVLLGPSGCGKTTLLRLIAGLEVAEDGRIVMDGTVVYDREKRIDVPPERRPASMVFQSYALWPHMTAFENVAYPLVSRRVRRREVRPRVQSVLDMVGVGRLGDQLPSQMSGGQQQRVALARAIVARQPTILFDEPLSNVDAKVRDRLRFEILAMQRELGFTAVYVTHDQEEAMTLGSRIAVLQDGQVMQLGTPREVYHHPASRYVANFVGVADEIEGQVVAGKGEEVVVETAIGRLLARASTGRDGRDVVLVMRPESWCVETSEVSHPNHLAGTIETAVFLGGARVEYVVRVADTRLRVWGSATTEELAPGTSVWLSASPESVLVFERT